MADHSSVIKHTYDFRDNRDDVDKVPGNALFRHVTASDIEDVFSEADQQIVRGRKSVNIDATDMAYNGTGVLFRNRVSKKVI